jgi:SAM-dependent methyltransferase
MQTNAADGSANFSFVDRAIKHFCGHRDPARVKVLDFGCGAGGLVERLCSLFYDAYGCDVVKCWDERTTDRLFVIAPNPYRLPFPDNEFDAVVSISVLEHAANKREIFEEIRRVLKPGGVCLHLFPSKWYLPTEPHVYVPLMSWLWPHVPRWWLALWAMAGLRAPFQKRLTWRQVVAANLEYARTGLSYWSNRRYRRLARLTFGNYESPMGFYVDQAHGGVAQLVRRLPGKPLFAALSGAVRMKFIVLRKPLPAA